MQQGIDARAAASIQQLHAEVLACERAVRDSLADTSARASFRNALDAEQRALEELGFSTYSAFAETLPPASDRDMADIHAADAGPHGSRPPTVDSDDILPSPSGGAAERPNENGEPLHRWHPAAGAPSGRGEAEQDRELQSLRETISRLQAELDRASDELAARGTAVQELQTALRASDAARVEQLAALGETQRELETQQSRVRAFEENIASSEASRVLVDDLDGVAAELQEARLRITKLESDVAAAQSTKAEFDEFRERLADHDVVASQLESAEAVIAQQREQIERLNAGIAEVLAASTAGWAAGEGPIEAALADLTSYLHRLEEAAAEARELRIQVNELLAAAEGLVEARDAANQRIIELERLVSSLSTERDSAAVEIDELRADLASVRSELQSQLELSEKLSGQVASITDELRSMRAGRASAFSGLFMPFRFLNAEVEKQRRRMQAMRNATCRSLRRLRPS